MHPGMHGSRQVNSTWESRGNGTGAFVWLLSSLDHTHTTQSRSMQPAPPTIQVHWRKQDTGTRPGARPIKGYNQGHVDS